MSFNVYHDPENVMLGDTPVPGVKSIVVSVRLQAVYFNDGRCETDARTSGAITVATTGAASTIANKTGTLSFVWKGKPVMIEKTSVGGYDMTAPDNAGSTVTLPFISDSAPVVTGNGAKP